MEQAAESLARIVDTLGNASLIMLTIQKMEQTLTERLSTIEGQRDMP